MSGKDILEAAGGITSSVQVIPNKSTYEFGENISGVVKIELSKPIFFVDQGLI